jgi:hypothetical protein
MFQQRATYPLHAVANVASASKTVASTWGSPADG